MYKFMLLNVLCIEELISILRNDSFYKICCTVKHKRFYLQHFYPTVAVVCEYNLCAKLPVIYP